MASNEQRGFAGMPAERQREIASQGGRAAHQQGTAHEFTPDEARAAGRKGGEAVSQNREHMARIGRKGGEASRRNTAARGGASLPSSHSPEIERPSASEPMVGGHGGSAAGSPSAGQPM